MKRLVFDSGARSRAHGKGVSKAIFGFLEPCALSLEPFEHLAVFGCINTFVGPAIKDTDHYEGEERL